MEGGRERKSARTMGKERRGKEGRGTGEKEEEEWGEEEGVRREKE